MKALLILSLTIFSFSAFAEKAEIGQRTTDCAKINPEKVKEKVSVSSEEAAKDGKKGSGK